MPARASSRSGGRSRPAPTSIPRVGSSRISTLGVGRRATCARTTFCWLPPLRLRDTASSEGVPDPQRRVSAGPQRRVPARGRTKPSVDTCQVARRDDLAHHRARTGPALAVLGDEHDPGVDRVARVPTPRPPCRADLAPASRIGTKERPRHLGSPCAYQSGETQDLAAHGRRTSDAPGRGACQAPHLEHAAAWSVPTLAERLCRVRARPSSAIRSSGSPRPPARPASARRAAPRCGRRSCDLVRAGG